MQSIAAGVFGKRRAVAGRAGGPEGAVEPKHAQGRVGRGERRLRERLRQGVVEPAFDDDAAAALQKIGGGEQQRALREFLRAGAGEGADQAFGGLAPDGLVGEMIKPREHFGHQPDAARRRAVMGDARADRGAVGRVRRGHEKPAVGRAEQGLRLHGAGPRRLEIAGFARRLEQRERGSGERGVIVEHSRGADAALAPGMGEAPLDVAEIVPDEREGRARRFEKLRRRENGGRARERGDHQAVPVGQNLVVERRLRPRLAQREEARARIAQAPLVGRLARRRHAAKNVGLLPIAAAAHVVGGLERGRVGPERGVDLLGVPDIKQPFLARLIGVLRGGEGVADAHLAHQPAKGFARARLVDGVGRLRVREREQFEDLRVVVKHLFEMRHMPFGVGRIARKTAAEMIVDAARAQRIEQRADRVAHARIAAAKKFVVEETEDRRVGKFRRAADAAVDGIEDAQQRLADLREIVRREVAAGQGRRLFGEMRHQPRALLQHLLALRAPGVLDRAQHLHEGRASPARRGRPIGAAVNRRSLGRQEHRQRPAALFAQRMQRGHVMMVDVRPLLAIDLDVDEAGVHHRGGVGILEGFMRHHMAPVTGGVADGEQDRAVARLRLGERFEAPGAPMHGIVRVLQQIRRGLIAEQIFFAGHFVLLRARAPA